MHTLKIINSKPEEMEIEAESTNNTCLTLQNCW